VEQKRQGRRQRAHKRQQTEQDTLQSIHFKTRRHKNPEGFHDRHEYAKHGKCSGDFKIGVAHAVYHGFLEPHTGAVTPILIGPYGTQPLEEPNPGFVAQGGAVVLALIGKVLFKTAGRGLKGHDNEATARGCVNGGRKRGTCGYNQCQRYGTTQRIGAVVVVAAASRCCAIAGMEIAWKEETAKEDVVRGTTGSVNLGLRYGIESEEGRGHSPFPDVLQQNLVRSDLPKRVDFTTGQVHKQGGGQHDRKTIITYHRPEKLILAPALARISLLLLHQLPALFF